MKNKKVVVGMSGGVDSSVTAYILKEKGYDVIGLTMQIWQDDDVCKAEKDGGCCGLLAVEDARDVCYKLDIQHYVLNFKKDFKEKVIDYFIYEYYNGKTPNPCIACNRYIKWESMLRKSEQLGADFISTGHYSKIVKNNENGRYTLEKAKDTKKDQTYALFNLSQLSLQKTLMPLGDYTKEEIREIAKNIGLNIYNKPDSQEICFIEDDNYGKFLAKNAKYPVKEGNFIDLEGNILGKHKGIIYYTVGQRKGLGVSFGKPMFVREIRANTNEIVLASDKDLYSIGLIADDINFMSLENIEGEITVFAKIRYSHKPCKAKIRVVDNILECIFIEPQRAITPGQAVVFYDNYDRIICGGTIQKPIIKS